MQKVYASVLSSVAEGCDGLPVKLREAARAAVQLPDRADHAAGLAAAAVEVLGPECDIPEPRGSAAELTVLCPLIAPDFPLEGPALVDMRAADWGFLIALQRSLTALRAYDARAERLLLSFALSSAILGEEERARARAK